MSQQAQETVVVPRGSLSAIVSYAETSSDLGVIGRRCLNELQQCLTAPISPDSDLLKEAVGLLDWIAGDVEEGITITRGMAGSIRAFLSKVEERGHD